MKYYPKLKLYKASNVTFNPETLEAWSYNWWQFVKLINGMVVFNNYNYSNSTCKHQSKVRGVLNDLGINIDYVVSSRVGLQDDNWIDDAKGIILNKIEELSGAINNPRSKEAKNIERVKQIRYLNQELIELDLFYPQK